MPRGVVAALASSHLLDLSESETYYSSIVRSYQLLAGVLVMAVVRIWGLRDDRRWLAAVGVLGLVVVGVGVSANDVLAREAGLPCDRGLTLRLTGTNLLDEEIRPIEALGAAVVIGGVVIAQRNAAQFETKVPSGV